MDGGNPSSRESELKKIYRAIDSINRRLDRLEAASGLHETKAVEETEVVEEPARPSKLEGTGGPSEPSINLRSLEVDVGKKLFSIMGVLSIFFGMVFLIAFSMSRGFLGPIGKVVVGVVVGLVLLVVGDILQKKEYQWFSRAVTGGGFGVLYLAVYAASASYNLIPQSLDSILLMFVMLMGVFFSFRHNSPLIATESFFFGYTIPVIGGISTYSLFYVIILSAFLISVCYKQDWFYLGVGGILVTYMIHLAWIFQTKDEPFSTNVLFLTAYFLVYTVASLTACRSKSEIQRQYGAPVLMVLNTLFYYITTLSLLNDKYPAYCGLFTLAMGALYLMLSSIAHKLGNENLFLTNLVAGLTLVTITVPIQFDDSTVTIAWAAETVIMILIGIQRRHYALRTYGNIVGFVAVVKTITMDSAMFPSGEGYLLITPRQLVYALTIVAFLVTSRVYHRFKEKRDYEGEMPGVYMFSALLITAVMMLVELDNAWITLAWSVLCVVISLHALFHYNALANESRRTMDYDEKNPVNAALASAHMLAWAIFLKLAIVDTSLAGGLSFKGLSDSRILAFGAGIAACYAAALVYSKLVSLKSYTGIKRFKTYFLLGTILLTLLLAKELEGAWISVAWSFEALILLAIGFAVKNKTVRTTGLILLMLTICKVFILDLAGLETFYRIISFMVLGVILLITSFAYSKFSSIIEKD